MSGIGVSGGPVLPLTTRAGRRARRRGVRWDHEAVAHTRFERPAMAFTLAVPGETTSALGARWQAETESRFGPESECENRLVVALGRHDVGSGLSVARSRLNLANILDVAESSRVPSFVVGPPPGRPEDGERLAELTAAFADVASRRPGPLVHT